MIAQKCVDEYNDTILSSTDFTPRYLIIPRVNDAVIELNVNKPKSLMENRLLTFENPMRIHNQNQIYLTDMRGVLNTM